MKNLQAASRQAQSVVTKMLTYDEKLRPSASDCVKLPWFANTKVASTIPLRDHMRVLTADNQQRAWQRAAIMQAATNLPAAKLSQLQETFRSMDHSNTGLIKKQDLKTTLQKLGVEPEAAGDAAAALMDIYDVDRSGTIEWTEFVAAMLPASKELLSDALDLSFQG